MYAVVDASVDHNGVAVLMSQFNGRNRRRRCQRHLDAGRPPGLRLCGRGQHERRRTCSGARRVVDGRRVAGDGRRRVKTDGRAVLFRVTLVSQSPIDVATAAQQYLLERRAEVAVETGVDDRVQKTVGEAEPQEEAGEPVRDSFAGVVFLTERSDESQYEERQPTGGERTHDHTQGLRHLYRTTTNVLLVTDRNHN